MSAKVDNILWNTIVTLFKLSTFVIAIITSLGLTVFLLAEGLNYEERAITVWIIGIVMFVALLVLYAVFGRWLFNQKQKRVSRAYIYMIVALFVGVGLFWYYINQNSLHYLFIMQEKSIDKRNKLMKEFVVKELGYKAISIDKQRNQYAIKENGTWKYIDYDFFQK